MMQDLLLEHHKSSFIQQKHLSSNGLPCTQSQEDDSFSSDCSAHVLEPHVQLKYIRTAVTAE